MNKRKVLWSVAILIALIAAIIQFGSLAIGSPTGSQISSNTFQLLRNMRNDDVIWNLTFFGVLPTEITGASLQLRDVKEDINSYLIEALIDQNRYVAAHVLLTDRSGIDFTIIEGEWNGLRDCLITTTCACKPP